MGSAGGGVAPVARGLVTAATSRGVGEVAGDGRSAIVGLGEGLGAADGAALATTVGACTAAFGVATGAAGAGFAGIGWMETYRPSQIIRFGAYRQGVKKCAKLRHRELRVRPHVVAVLALEAEQRPDDPHARDLEVPGLGWVGGGAEPGEDPAVVAMRDGDATGRFVRRSLVTATGAR